MKRQLRMLLAGVNSFCFKHSKGTVRWVISAPQAEVQTSVIWSEIRLSLESSFMCWWRVCHCPVTSLASCILPLFLCYRTHPFSRCWLPSLSALEWPLLILLSFHLDGGLLIRLSGLPITTVSLSFTKPLWGLETAKQWALTTGNSTQVVSGHHAFPTAQDPASPGPRLQVAQAQSLWDGRDALTWSLGPHFCGPEERQKGW